MGGAVRDRGRELYGSYSSRRMMGTPTVLSVAVSLVKCMFGYFITENFEIRWDHPVDTAKVPKYKPKI